MLVLKNRDHVVKMSIQGLANIARVSAEECKAALAKFKEPDEDSTNKANEGRKIREIEGGGWLILNGEYYARLLSWDERREYNRAKQAEYRARKKPVKQRLKAIRHDGACAGAKQAIDDGLKEASEV
jgi:hypothetical protein